MESNLSGKRILITGGTGFIASFVIEKFYPNNKITVFDNGRRNAFKFLPKNIQDKIDVVEGDIRNIDQVKKVVKKKDIVIHLAAIAGASFYEKDPLLTLSVNLFGTANLLDAVKDQKLNRIIIFSSSEVYGSEAYNMSEQNLTCIGPVSEGRWSYAISKIAADHLAMAYFKKYNLPIVIVRPFNIYGPRQVGEGAISNMILTAIRDKKIYVTGLGNQKRAWCYVEDLVCGIDKILKKDIRGECFNIGNPEEYISIIELAKAVQLKLKEAKIIFLKGKKIEILRRSPDIKKANKLLKFIPQINLDEGLGKTSEWFKENIKYLR